MSHQHITDLAAYALAAAGAAVTIMPPDYAALGVAAIGGIIGGFLSVSIVPESASETRRSVGVKWAVSTLTSITITPFLFQRWTQPTADPACAAVKSLDCPMLAAMLPNTAEAMLALSTSVAFIAWVSLRLAQAAWERWLRGWLLGPAPAPKRNRRASDGEDARP